LVNPQAYQADIAKFEKADTQVLGISVDSPFANKKFAEEIGVDFPLLSDLNKKVSKLYGVLNDDVGVARRATFVVDKQGIVRGIEQDKAALDPSGAHNVCMRLAAGQQ
jgi:peroxiredoxin (alkyl hydroperoxide reductase subunit C)